MESSFCHASGIIIITAWGSERPPMTRSSSTSSNDAESEAPSVTTGKNRLRSRFEPSDHGEARVCADMSLSRARIQLRLPRTVLISPLWAIIRKGCASGQDGKVFVENREWTSAIRDTKRSSRRSG